MKMKTEIVPSPKPLTYMTLCIIVSNFFYFGGFVREPIDPVQTPISLDNVLHVRPTSYESYSPTATAKAYMYSPTLDY